MTERYIHIRNWDRFQHYKKRGAPWIKDYVAQLDDHDYLTLTSSQRGILHGLRLMYAASAQLGLSEDIARTRLAINAGEARHFRTNIEALNHAGLILISASKVLAAVPKDASPEGETETEELQRGVSATKYEARPVEEKPYLNNIAGDIGTRIASLEQARERRTA